MTKPDLDAAAQFLATSGRILDRRRFDRLLADGPAQPVRDAVAAYRNTDGGFGQGLEPDVRTPASQPAATELALRTLHDTDAWDAELAADACDWLQSRAPAGGGAVFVEPTAEGWPRAPWWVPETGRPASLISTGLIAGTLHARQVRHPWLEAATSLLWDRIDALPGSAGAGSAGAGNALAEPGAYEMLGVFRFLDHVPDRERALNAARRTSQLLLDKRLVELEPGAPGETHSPLDFAPRPGCVARSAFSDAVIERHLDHLAGAQQADGGWKFNWLSWSPSAEQDWRGWVTVDALAVLRANGRC
jgi:hypothetical protein